MYSSSLFIPVFGSCLAGLFGRFLGSCGSAILTTSCLFVLFFLNFFFIFYGIGLVSCFIYIKLTAWISSSEVFGVNKVYNVSFFKKQFNSLKIVYSNSKTLHVFLLCKITLIKGGFLCLTYFFYKYHLHFLMSESDYSLTLRFYCSTDHLLFIVTFLILYKLTLSLIIYVKDILKICYGPYFDWYYAWIIIYVYLPFLKIVKVFQLVIFLSYFFLLCLNLGVCCLKPLLVLIFTKVWSCDVTYCLPLDDDFSSEDSSISSYDSLATFDDEPIFVRSYNTVRHRIDVASLETGFRVSDLSQSLSKISFVPEQRIIDFDQVPNRLNQLLVNLESVDRYKNLGIVEFNDYGFDSPEQGRESYTQYTRVWDGIYRILLHQGPNPYRQLEVLREIFFPQIPQLSTEIEQLRQALFLPNSAKFTDQKVYSQLAEKNDEAIQCIKDIFCKHLWEPRAHGFPGDKGSLALEQVLHLWFRTLNQQHNPSDNLVLEQLYHGLLQRSPLVYYDMETVSKYSYIPRSRFVFEDFFLSDVYKNRVCSKSVFANDSVGLKWHALSLERWPGAEYNFSNDKTLWLELMAERKIKIEPFLNFLTHILSSKEIQENNLQVWSDNRPDVIENLYRELLSYWKDPKEFLTEKKFVYCPQQSAKLTHLVANLEEVLKPGQRQKPGETLEALTAVRDNLSLHRSEAFKVCDHLNEAFNKVATVNQPEQHPASTLNEISDPVFRVLQDACHQYYGDRINDGTLSNPNEILAEARRDLMLPSSDQAMSQLRRVLFEQGPDPFRQFGLIEEVFLPLVPNLNLSSAQLKQALFQEPPHVGESMNQLVSVLSDSGSNSSGRLLKQALNTWENVLSVQSGKKDPDLKAVLNLLEDVLRQQGKDPQRQLEVVEKTLTMLLPDRDISFEQLEDAFFNENPDFSTEEVYNLFQGSPDPDGQILTQMLRVWKDVY